MRSLLFSAALFALLTPLAACGGGGATDMFPRAECEDGEDNDGDGTTDFPDDLSCTSEGDDDEGAPAAPACKDGRDNDGDGKTDFPNDPGCYATHQDNEDDDCPDGPGCPQCSDGEDNDGNGQTDFPNDSGGCNAASDNDEYTRNLAACGSNVKIEPLPFDGNAMGMLDTMGVSSLISPMCGGAGIEAVYELRVTSPKVIVATTDNDSTAADTVLYIRGAECSNGASELACSNDISTTNKKSTVTYSATKPGTYYLVVDSKDAATAGAFKVNVRYLTGEGETCAGADDCGPGLLCRVPAGQTTKVCAKYVCEDGLDDDADGKIDYPNDPGCTTPKDETETDSCPGVGPSCPECGDGVDNDGDGKMDFGPAGDMTCKAAGDASEACVSSEGVTSITTAMVMGDTTNATNDSKPTCASSSTTAMAPDLMYRLDLPAMATLSLNTTGFDTATALYDSTCGGTAIACSDPALMTVTNIAAGTYYFVVDGWSTGKGAFTIAVSGTIQNGQSCEGQLAQAGVITCATGYACKGNSGSRTCQPATCADGLDNDSDGKIDYPFDPGCDSLADDTEANPTTAPVCSNGGDDDTDGAIDYPADFGCAAASATSEVFCMGETDAAALITTAVTTGTTAGAANDSVPSCATTSTAPDKAFALHLPVQVASLQVDSIGSQFDTVISVRSLNCATTVQCNDDGAAPQSKINMSNVTAGGYAVIVDGWQANSGAFTLNVKGTVAPQTSCTSPLFSGGANAVLSCPTGTTCTGTPAKCQ